jgi:hypothetical protein
MTDEQKAAYLKGGAQKCPYCGGDELDCDRLELGDFEDEYECRTRCMKCGKEWTDVYRVADVRGHEDDDAGWEEEEEANDG